MNTLKSRFPRERFVEAFNDGVLPLVRVEAPVEVNGRVRVVSTYVEEQPKEEVPYSAFTAARVYEMGDVTPISLFNNMSSVERLEYVQKFDGMVERSMSNEVKSE